MNFHLTQIPERTAKPRAHGLTMVNDKGLSVMEAQHLISGAGPHVDLVKLAFGTPLFSGGLRNVFSLADLKMNRLLDTFDEWALTSGRDAEFGAPERFAPTVPPGAARLQVDLRSGEIAAVVWATGFRPDYGWLDVPVVDEKGHLRHDGGVTDSPGLYALGLPVLRRRKSTFIYGIEDDAREVIDHLAGHLAVPR